MIYFYRCGTVAPGKLVPAMSFARDIVSLIKSKTGKDVTVGVPVGGQAGRLAWFVEYENLGQLEEFQSKLLQDSEYQALLAKGGENFVAGSMHDEIWRII